MIQTKSLNNEGVSLFIRYTIIITMENPTKQNEDTNEQHPKPTEEIQLDIETVTPDTEKDGLPNDEKDANRSSEKPVEDASEKEESEETAKEEEVETEEPVDEEELEAEKGKDDGAPDIETVSV